MKSEKPETSKTKNNFDKTILTVVAILGFVIILIAISLFIFPNPLERKNQRLDSIILNDFNDIQYEISNYYREYSTLPVSLSDEELVLPQYIENSIEENNYNYEIISSDKFKLCANFHSSNWEERNRPEYIYEITPRHNAGYDCITYKVNLDNRDIPTIEVAPESR